MKQRSPGTRRRGSGIAKTPAAPANAVYNRLCWNLAEKQLPLAPAHGRARWCPWHSRFAPGKPENSPVGSPTLANSPVQAGALVGQSGALVGSLRQSRARVKLPPARSEALGNFARLIRTFFVRSCCFGAYRQTVRIVQQVGPRLRAREVVCEVDSGTPRRIKPRSCNPCLPSGKHIGGF